jgi:murein L,D-transpeptidase YafK
MQTPEGFYYIDRFNPYSSFHLSLGINYPNSADRKLSPYSNLGGDIFIHGSCCTIGCIPITDDKIKEFYLMAVEARNQGQTRVPVHIFPAKISDKMIATFKSKYSKNNTLLNFWINLKEGYDYFEMHRLLPKVSVNENGKYLFSN